MSDSIRINVTGNAGAGKTTLARQIGEALGVPMFSLDSIVWRPGWQKTPPEERQALEQELIAKPSWVIDGVSAHIRAAADLVIFLDMPRYLCAWRAIGRNLRYFHRTRPGLPVNCPEWRILPRLLQIIWQFPTHAGRTIREEARHSPARYRIITRTQDFAAIVDHVIVV